MLFTCDNECLMFRMKMLEVVLRVRVEVYWMSIQFYDHDHNEAKRPKQ